MEYQATSTVSPPSFLTHFNFHLGLWHPTSLWQRGKGRSVRGRYPLRAFPRPYSLRQMKSTPNSPPPLSHVLFDFERWPSDRLKERKTERGNETRPPPFSLDASLLLCVKCNRRFNNALFFLILAGKSRCIQLGNGGRKHGRSISGALFTFFFSLSSLLSFSAAFLSFVYSQIWVAAVGHWGGRGDGLSVSVGRLRDAGKGRSSFHHQRGRRGEREEI